MSFSSNIKEDLIKLRVKSPAQRLSLLCGLTLCCGALYIGRGRGVSYATESLSVGKLILSLGESAYRLEGALGVVTREGRKNPLTTVTLTGEDGERLCLEMGLLRREGADLALGDGVPLGLVNSDEGARLLLRGAFLGSGSCSNPARGYHLELVTHSPGVAGDLAALINKAGVNARLHRRREQQVVYCKGEDVTGFLALIGAGGAALKFESVRTEKDFRNYVNRKSNCETANIGKTVSASVTQRNAIDRIERRMELSRLPQPLYEAAMLRLSNPDATLQELADMAEIGKSGMNHRMARLLKLAEEMEE